MKRDQPAPTLCPDVVLNSVELSRLRSVFRRALGVAFASSLVAAGCSNTLIGDPAAGVSAAGRGATRPAAGGAGARASEPAPSGARDGGAPANGSRDASQPTTGPSVADANVGDQEAGSARAPDAQSADAAISPASGPICDGGAWQQLAGLQSAQPADYVSLRTTYEYAADGYQETAHLGEPCANAVDATACRDELAALAADLEFSDSCGMVGPCRRYLVTTRADEASLYATREALLQFLGPLSNAQEVFLLLDYDGYSVSCDVARVTPTAGGFEAVVQLMINNCPVQMARVTLSVSASGDVRELARELEPATNVCVGRRPEGLRTDAARPGRSALGNHFAEQALLEAASVTAFDVLANELAAHAAPSELIEAARAAASDEVRHAQRTAELARRFGATPSSWHVEPRPLRSLEALALDNAVEGCVRETFGAVIGCYQARVARDAQIAEVMGELGEDETRHAALALAIQTWIWPKLTPVVQATISEARAAAIATLARELSSEPNVELRALAGVPDARTAARLHASMVAELWSDPVDA